MAHVVDAEAAKTKHMDVQRALLDKDFDRYVLSTEGIEKQFATLPARALAPLDAAQTVRKAQWDARVHHNALVADPFLSEDGDTIDAADQRSVAYYVSAEYELMQVIYSKVCLAIGRYGGSFFAGGV